MIEHRFAISALSKQNKDSAYPEEIMIDKYTSEILIKTPDGDIVSFNYLDRFKNNLNNLKNRANYLKVFGNIYNIEFANTIELPKIVESGMNYLDEPCTLSLSLTERTHFKHFVINCDISTYKYEENKITLDELYPEFSLTMSLTFNDDTTTDINIVTTPLKSNEKIFKLEDYLNTTELEKGIKSISFSNFSLTDKIIDRNESEVLDKDNIRTILYSLFILLER